MILHAQKNSAAPANSPSSSIQSTVSQEYNNAKEVAYVRLLTRQSNVVVFDTLNDFVITYFHHALKPAVLEVS